MLENNFNLDTAEIQEWQQQSIKTYNEKLVERRTSKLHRL